MANGQLAPRLSRQPAPMRRPGNLKLCVQTMLGPERKARPLPDFAIARPSAVEAVLRKSAKSMPTPADSASDPATAEDVIGSKKALAADLEGMIQGMLRTTQFATAATARTRSWSRQIGEVAALDASTDDSAFAASSLVEDMSQAGPVPASTAAQAAAPRHRWIDAVLALACLLSVASAGYFTFAP
jgi:hypothetical protein